MLSPSSRPSWASHSPWNTRVRSWLLALPLLGGRSDLRRPARQATVPRGTQRGKAAALAVTVSYSPSSAGRAPVHRPRAAAIQQEAARPKPTHSNALHVEHLNHTVHCRLTRYGRTPSDVVRRRLQPEGPHVRHMYRCLFHVEQANVAEGYFCATESALTRSGPSQHAHTAIGFPRQLPFHVEHCHHLTGAKHGHATLFT